MIEVYSKDVTVASNQLIPFNIVALKKGATVTNSGSYEFVFNQCGIYELTVSAVATPVAAAAVTQSGTSAAAAQTGTSALADEDSKVGIQLIKDGVAVPQAMSEESQTTAAALSFTTLVQINRNNSPCVCSTPVVCSISNIGSEATFSNVDVVITKIV